MENVLEIMPRYAPGKPPGPPFDANTSYDRSIILCAGTSTTCSATHPVPRSCGTTYKTPRLVHEPETQGHQKFAHRCAAVCAPAARTGSNPTFHSEPEIRAHAQFGKRYSLASALVEGATPDCAHTHHSVKNTTRSCTDVVFVRDGLSPVSYLSPFVCAALSLPVRACLCFLSLSLPVRVRSSSPPSPPPSCSSSPCVYELLPSSLCVCGFISLLSRVDVLFFCWILFFCCWPSLFLCESVFCIGCWPGPFPCGCVFVCLAGLASFRVGECVFCWSCLFPSFVFIALPCGCVLCVFAGLASSCVGVCVCFLLALPLSVWVLFPVWVCLLCFLLALPLPVWCCCPLGWPCLFFLRVRFVLWIGLGLASSREGVF